VGELAHGFARFGLVGLTGLAVNTLALAAFAEGVGLHYLVAAALASQVSTLWNFALTDLWVFRGRRLGRSRLGRLALFALMNNAALLLRSPILVLLTSVLGVHYLLSNLISLGLLTLVRYGVADVWIWARDPLAPPEPASHRYDVHGLLSVRSDVALPELEKFRAGPRPAPPAVDVRIGRVGGEPSSNGHRRISYREGPRGIGFGLEIAVGANVEVVAGAPLRLSPHVLYTNVVEPILRWAFVERGYALVHGACLARGDRALLITARTDTGKTTTALKALQAHPWSFLSDDLTLVTADGHVLAYPKPLTISRHTLRAVDQSQLSRRERAGLVVQSQIHSRPGRRFAMLIARAHLPAASINLAVQALIPPPKYHVQRLIPTVALGRRARLERMVVIERDGEGTYPLPESEALETLLANCADAYGFPPYDAIEGFLNNGGGRDLRLAERAIIASALHGVPATLLRSRTMDWWQRLPDLAERPEAAVPVPVRT
jgi:putative flippase GtrA